MMAMTMLSLSCANGGSKDGSDGEANDARDFKTMIVEYQNDYEMMGMKISIHETKWIDEKNKKEASLEKKSTTFMGATTVEESLEITDGDWAYMINMLEKTGTKTNTKAMQDMAKAMVATGVADIDAKNLKEFVETNGGAVLSNEEILGKDCMVYEMMGTKNWIYKGIILKSIMGGKVIIQAISVDENASIPSNRFEVPAGITITEVENPMM